MNKYASTLKFFYSLHLGFLNELPDKDFFNTQFGKPITYQMLKPLNDILSGSNRIWLWSFRYQLRTVASESKVRMNLSRGLRLLMMRDYLELPLPPRETGMFMAKA
ncbi:hypothetical protein SAMN06295888_1332 [Desulfonatronum zhilinae]|nr:hypothetical protein SAMN06295888_1332 [Desulfonatronum zhilinae]